MTSRGMKCAAVSAIGLALGALLLGCGAPEQNRVDESAPAAGSPTAPTPAAISEPPLETLRATPTVQRTLEQLWADGPAYFASAEELAKLRTDKSQEVYGVVLRKRVMNVPGLARHQLNQYLIRIEKVAGNPEGARYHQGTPGATAKSEGGSGTTWREVRDSSEAGWIENARLASGDLMWINVRIVSDDRPHPAELVARNDRIWALFEKVPTIATDSFLSEDATPTAWTSGLAAFAMANGMTGK